ncbi:MAG: hypothetical protein K6G45_01900 [Lachnospiraceae bacterium]|nr:hypothetical protein [Lachnospiraceae bacterium]
MYNSDAGRGKFFRLILWVSAFFAVVFFMYSAADKGFQSDSEDLAVGPVYAATEGAGFETEGYGLGRLTFKKYPEKEVYNNVVLNGANLDVSYKYKPYRSQIGLQGMIYSGIAGLLSGFMSFKIIYHGFRFACLLLFVLILLFIVLQLFKRYGLLFAAVFGAVTILSPWTQNFAGNLYWVEFTWFIPFLLSLLILNHHEKRFVIYPFIFIAILVKCLCGYEYLSTIIISGIMFPAVEWLIHKEERKKLFKIILVTGILSLLAFAAAFLIHAHVYGSGNIGEGIRLLKTELVEKRTYGDALNFNEMEGTSLNASVFTVLWKYIGFGTIQGGFMLPLFAATVIALILERKRLRSLVSEGTEMGTDAGNPDKNRDNTGINTGFETAMFVLAFLAALSWFVLAKGHSYIHTHINFVMYYMGWVQVSVYIIVRNLKRYLRKR